MAIVGEPLVPAVLAKMGALGGWPPPAEKFDPGGNWSHTYRIWTCHGYTDKGNANRGVLQIERSTDAANGTFTLNVRRRVVHVGDLVHELEARVECRADEIASPRKWSVASRFFGPDGKERKDIGLERKGAEAGNQKRPAEWCLFEALQRRPFRKERPVSFDLFEELTTLRPEQRIYYAGPETFGRTGAGLTLHRFYQLGRGTLPYTYWLDEKHRLLLIVSHDKAYILDPKAESRVRWHGKRVSRKGK